MKSIFKKLISIGLIATAIVLSGCDRSKIPSDEVVVGTIAGPETELMQVAQQVAQKDYGLKVKIVTFSDYTMPNEALNDGSINANAFQTLPYLQTAIAAKGYQLTAVGKTFIYPMGLYSKKYKSLSTLPNGATVAIPNDPSNEARSLLLLQSAKLITLKAGAGTNATTFDIVANPRQLKISTLGAAQLPRALGDVDLAAINTNYAVPAGLYPSRDALFQESSDSPYANLVVVKTADQNDVKFQQLVNALHSQQVVDAANKLFQGQAVPAWTPNVTPVN